MRSPRPNILLLCLDAVRGRELLDPETGPRLAPNFHALASRGLLFTQCFASAPWTLPSLASLFTGRFPSEHGAVSPHSRFIPQTAPLAETLAPTHETISVSQNPFFSYRFNLTQGFSRNFIFGRYSPAFFNRRIRFTGIRRYLELLRLLPSGIDLRRDPGGFLLPIRELCSDGIRAAEGALWVNGMVRRLFRSRPNRPLFILAAYMESHWPYRFDSTAGFLDEEQAADIRSKVGDCFPWGPITRQPALSPRDRNHLAALYFSSIRYLDARISELLEALNRQNALDRTYVVIFADHGEMLGEHGLYGHALTLHNAVLHVPLLIVPPRGESWGEVFSKRFRLQDLRDLILLITRRDRQSLRRHLQSYPEQQPIFAEYAGVQDRLTPSDRDRLASGAFWTGPQQTVLIDRWKIVTRGDGETRLYDIVQDPNEVQDLSRSAPEATAALVRAHRSLLSQLNRPESGPASVDLRELQDRLRGLGYL